MKTDPSRRAARWPGLPPWAALAALLVGGCAVGPDYAPPKPSAPAAWSGASPAPREVPSTVTSAAPELTHWWRQFNDPKLNELVEEAVKANLDLKLAGARVRQARAARGIAIAGLMPSVDASAAFTRLHPAGVRPTTDQQSLYQSGLDAIWELDVFGGHRRSVESASAGLQAAVEGVHDAQVSVVAEVALNYLQLRGYQQQLAISRKNLEAQRHTAGITHQRLTAGFASGLDAANADAQTATMESELPTFEALAQQAIHALGVLLARPPADLLAELSPAGSLPGVPAGVPTGMPSDLLRRRPDIRQAEAQLHAATAEIGVAVADLFPKFSLTGSVGWQSNLLKTWWAGLSRSFGFGPSVTWPIFQGGAIVSNVHGQESLRDQAWITYQKTVLTAFQEVENALVGFAREQERRRSLNDAVVANRKAVDLSTRLYTEGLGDLLNVLIAQRLLYATEDALVQSERAVATDLVALYKALGGGWEEEAPAEPPVDKTPAP